MQAHLQSPTAARKHPPDPRPAQPDGGQVPELPFQPVIANARPNPNPLPPIATTSGLAHDAANLLVALGLYCDMLAVPGVLRPQHAHYAEELRHLADRSSSLVRGLIDRMPSASEPKSSLPVPLVDPAAILRSFTPLLAAIAAPAAAVSVTMPPSLPGVRFPAEALERILVNLVRNAAQAIERSQARSHLRSQALAPGAIQIVLASSAKGLHLTVEDNGPGMPMLDAAAFLAPSPLLPGARHGLGHLIISELVTATKGTLTVRVRPGRGTRFVILWPVCTGTSGNPASPSSTGPSEVRAC